MDLNKIIMDNPFQEIADRLDRLDVTMNKIYDLLVTNYAELDKNKPKDDGLLTAKETAKLLRISVPTLYAWTYAGSVIKYRIGGRVFYKRGEVMDSLRSIRVK